VASHPTDEERAEAAAPLVRRALAALAGTDASALGDVLRDDAVAITADGVERGRRHAAHALLAAARGARTWHPPRAHGAHALLRYTRGDESVGGIVLEARRDAIVFAAVLG